MIRTVGDVLTVQWVPVDGTGTPVTPAAVTATVASPTGATPVAVTGTGPYQATVVFTTTGDWAVTWTSTSPDLTSTEAFAVLPVPQTASWAPSLRKVGSHIPSRTRSVETGDPTGTFDALTVPDGDQVTVIIGSATAVVAGVVGRPVVPAAMPLCETAAALWSAYWVELAWPGRDADVSVFGRLRDDAVMLMEQAKAVNLGAGGGTEGTPDTDGVPNVSSSWSFPPPPRHRF